MTEEKFVCTPELIRDIKKEENEFPKRFASYEEKDYGNLYYMKDNKDSYDGNHAVLFPDRITDLGAVLDDIQHFYQALNRRASIYHPFAKNYFADNESVLKEHGFTYTREDAHRVMLLTEASTIRPDNTLNIKVLHDWDERVATDILLPSGEPWEVEVTKQRLLQGNSLLFVGYKGEKAVVHSDIHVSLYNNTRFDYIVTAKDERGHGYASELLSFMVQFCRENHLPNCWQWAGPSEHICYHAGFREIFTMEAGYAAGPEIK